MADPNYGGPTPQGPSPLWNFNFFDLRQSNGRVCSWRLQFHVFTSCILSAPIITRKSIHGLQKLIVRGRHVATKGVLKIGLLVAGTIIFCFQNFRRHTNSPYIRHCGHWPASCSPGYRYFSTILVLVEIFTWHIPKTPLFSAVHSWDLQMSNSDWKELNNHLLELDTFRPISLQFKLQKLKKLSVYVHFSFKVAILFLN